MNGDGAHDHETLNSITERAKLLLADTELEFTDAKAFPLIEGESTGPEWDSSHSGESVVESTFGLVFVKF
jgi:hypothetical protein